MQTQSNIVTGEHDKNTKSRGPDENGGTMGYKIVVIAGRHQAEAPSTPAACWCTWLVPGRVPIGESQREVKNVVVVVIVVVAVVAVVAAATALAGPGGGGFGGARLGWQRGRRRRRAGLGGGIFPSPRTCFALDLVADGPEEFCVGGGGGNQKPVHT